MMKLTSLVNSARYMMDQKEVTVRELSQLLGAMVAAHPAILPAPLHYPQIERTSGRGIHSTTVYQSTMLSKKNYPGR